MRNKGFSTLLILIICWTALPGQENSRKVLYEEMVPREFRKSIAEAPIAYLPLGTLEWHSEHLPLGSDGLQSKKFFEILAQEAGGIVLPMYFLGPDMSKMVDGKRLIGSDYYLADELGFTEQQLDGSAYWVPDTLFYAMVDATLSQLKRAGFKIVVYHGHGPSGGFVQKRAEEWEKKYDIKMFNCWDDSPPGYGIMTDHAAMNETSLVMAMYPELVHMEYLPTDMSEWPLAVNGRDPRKFASPEVGNEIIEYQKKRMTKILKKALSEL